jgi:hypothetical protein
MKFVGTSILALTIAFALPASPVDARLRLNHEAMKLRLAAETQIEAMTTLQETLRLCNMLFPIRITAVSKRDSTVVNAEKIYKKILAMNSSTEIFKWLLDFLSEDEALRKILQKTFIQAEENGRQRQDLFIFGGTKFYVRWFWLYPTQNGLLLAAQDEMTQETADEIWDAQVLCPIYELRFPISPAVRESPFWEKGVMKILKAFPSAHITEEPSQELVYAVFPSSSGIPNIVRRSVELLD